MIRAGAFVCGCLVLLVGGCGRHKAMTRPAILSSYAPTPVQAPPLRQSHAIPVPTAPVGQPGCAAPACPTPVVPVVPAQPAPGPFSNQVVPVPAPSPAPLGYGYSPLPTPQAAPAPAPAAVLGTPTFGTQAGFNSAPLTPPATVQVAPRSLFGRPLEPPPPPSTGF